MKAIKKYMRVFLLGIQSSMEYRVNFILSLLSTVFPILIQFFLWSAIFENAGSERVYGYTFAQMLLYVVLAGIVSKFVSTGFEYEVTEDIKLGGLNRFIVQPISYFFFRIIKFIGEKIANLIIMAVIIGGVLFAFSFTLELRFEVFKGVYFTVALLGALALNFLIFFCLSTAAFKMAEISHLYEIVRILIIIISGGIFPLDIFGSKILSILSFTPFSYLAYYPINILNGRLGQDEILRGAVIQLIWIAIFALLCLFMWKRGMKKYVAVGG